MILAKTSKEKTKIPTLKKLAYDKKNSKRKKIMKNIGAAHFVGLWNCPVCHKRQTCVYYISPLYPFGVFCAK